MAFAEIEVDQRFHKHIIGKNGANSKFLVWLKCNQCNSN